MSKRGPDDDAGLMSDLTLQACDRLVEKVWLKVLQDGPIDIDEMIKCTVVLANCINIVATVIEHADEFIDDTELADDEDEGDKDEDE